MLTPALSSSAPSPGLEPSQVQGWADIELPLPGSGRTQQRWDGLVELGRADLALAKVVEPHHDARAICAELNHPPPEAGTLWQVWAAEPPGQRLVASRQGDRWRLDGVKAFCSGAGLATHALVTAGVKGRSALFAVEVASAVDDGALRYAPPTWVGAGMARAGTRSSHFDRVPAVAIGPPGVYAARAGFWHGAIGVAACWAGGTNGVAASLLAAARTRPLDQHALAHLGAVTAAVDRCAAVLAQAATEIDLVSDPNPGRARRRAESVRATVVAAAEEVVARLGRALGPAPLAFDPAHSQRVADLQVFCRQHHAERDLAALGEAVAAGHETW